MSEVGYLCDNFSLSRPLCSRLRPVYATDKQTSDRDVRHMSDAQRRLMPLPYGGGA